MPSQPRRVFAPTIVVDLDHRQRLVALRDRLDLELAANPTSAAVAALARQLQAVLAELAAMPDPDAPATALELLQARRAARLDEGGPCE